MLLFIWIVKGILNKLDIISKNVDEIRLDNKDISKSLQSLAERVSAVESSTKSAHHRLDNIEDSMRKW